MNELQFWKLGFKIIQSVKLYLKAICLIVFSDVKTTFKIPWFKISVWNFEMHKGMLKISFIMRLWMNWVPNISGGSSILTRLISWSQGVMFSTGLANSKRISLSKSFVLIPWLSTHKG